MSWMMKRLTAVYLSFEFGLNKIIKNAIVISVYKIPHATGKYAGGGVSGGFLNVSYQKFILVFFIIIKFLHSSFG